MAGILRAAAGATRVDANFGRAVIFDGYLRISKLNGREGENFISPAVQREQIAEWATTRGVTIATVFEEFDESGGRPDRPFLMDAIARIEAGLTNGLVVASLDRFGRSLVDGLLAIDRIQAAGGGFVAVGDGFDIDTDTGKLVLRIMLSIAEWELDRVRSQWSTARERAVQRGAYTGPRPPVGYLCSATRRLVPDPRVAPVIVETFRRRADGATLRELAENLAERGVPALGVWRPGTVGQILRNRVYLGELRSGGFVNPAAHKPIVPHALWQAAQMVKLRASRRQARKPTVFGGLLRCAGCGLVLSTRTAVSEAGTEYRIYSCNGEAASICRSRASVLSRVVEPYVDAMYFGLLWAADAQAGAHPRLRQLVGRLAAARAETERYRDSSRALRALGAERFAQGLARRVDCEQRLGLVLSAERARLGLTEELDAEQLEAAWPELSISERRQKMSAIVDTVFVLRGRGRPEDRVIVCARGEGPADVPRRGRIGSSPAPAHIAQLHARAASSVVDPPAWSEDRIRRELAAYLAIQSGERWPTDDRFVHDGRGPLLRQLELSGGAPYWHREIGSEAQLPALRYYYWTDANIAATLRVLMRDYGQIPSGQELAQMGYTGLSVAIARRGAGHWIPVIQGETPEEGVTTPAAGPKK